VLKQYTIAEIAEKLQVSKVTVYNKIKDFNLKEFTEVNRGVKYLNQEGFEVLNESIGLTLEQYKEFKGLNKEFKEPPINLLDTLNIEVQTVKNEYINHLKTQIETKDNQIFELMEQLKNKDRLLANSQIIQKQQQDKIFLLEDHETKEKHSFWNKFISKLF
jgi:hypothetical protein